MHERLKQLRFELKLTQQEFSERIGVKRGTLANYELGRNEPIDAVISLICREFRVNEHWLRNGVGEMFETLDEEQIITEFLADVLRDEPESIRRRFIYGVAQWEQKDWQWLDRLIDTFTNRKTDP